MRAGPGEFGLGGAEFLGVKGCGEWTIGSELRFI